MSNDPVFYRLSFNFNAEKGMPHVMCKIHETNFIDIDCIEKSTIKIKIAISGS